MKIVKNFTFVLLFLTSQILPAHAAARPGAAADYGVRRHAAEAAVAAAAAMLAPVAAAQPAAPAAGVAPAVAHNLPGAVHAMPPQAVVVAPGKKKRGRDVPIPERKAEEKKEEKEEKDGKPERKARLDAPVAGPTPAITEANPVSATAATADIANKSQEQNKCPVCFDEESSTNTFVTMHICTHKLCLDCARNLINTPSARCVECRKKTQFLADFCNAIKNNQADEINKLLSQEKHSTESKEAHELRVLQGTNIKEKNPELLLFAMLVGHYPIIELLLDLGFDPTKRIFSMVSFENIIDTEKQINEIKLLIGENPSALDLAASLGLHKIVKMYCTKTPNIVHARNANGQTLLHLAILNDTYRRDLAKTMQHSQWSERQPRHQNLKLTLEALIEAKSDVNAVNSTGQTPLHHTINSSQPIEIIQLLIDAGANADIKIESGVSPLHYAMQLKAPLENIQPLIDAGNKVDAVDADGNTPLHYAIAYNLPMEVIQTLIINNAKIAYQNLNDETPLSHAIEDKKLDVIDVLCNTCIRQSEVALDAMRNTAIGKDVGSYFSVILENCTHISLIMYKFLTNIADLPPSTRDLLNSTREKLKTHLTSAYLRLNTTSGTTPLMHAIPAATEPSTAASAATGPSAGASAAGGLGEGSKDEEKKDAVKDDVSIDRSDFQATILYLKNLLEKKSDPNTSDENNYLPLYYAVTLKAINSDELQAQIDIVDALVAAGADPNFWVQDDSILHHAIESKAPLSVIQKLIDANAAVNAKNRKGITPLGLAVSNGDTDLIRLLITKNAPIDCLDIDNVSLLFKAIFYQKKDVVALLCQTWIKHSQVALDAMANVTTIKETDDQFVTLLQACTHVSREHDYLSMRTSSSDLINLQILEMLNRYRATLTRNLFFGLTRHTILRAKQCSALPLLAAPALAPTAAPPAVEAPPTAPHPQRH